MGEADAAWVAFQEAVSAAGLMDPEVDDFTPVGMTVLAAGATFATAKVREETGALKNALANWGEKALKDSGRLLGALQQIRDEEGKVCERYEECTHRACNSSYTSWAIADAALRGVRGPQPRAVLEEHDNP